MTPGAEKPPLPGDEPPEATQSAPRTRGEAQPANPPPDSPPEKGWDLRRWLTWGAGGVGAVLAFALGGPCAYRAFTTVSTDDAYVSGHVTFVAPRVAGQVARVLVDDDNRVRKGDVLVELDKEPYRVKVGIAQAALGAAQAELAVAQAQTRGLEGQARSLRFNLQNAMEEVNDQVALLHAKVAVLRSREATLARAQADFDREVPLVKSGVASKQQYDLYKEKLRVARARVAEAKEGVTRVRVGLGLPARPPPGHDLAEVPPDIDQSFSSVKEAQAKLIQVASELGVVGSYDTSPKEMLAEFYKRDPEGNIDRIFAKLAENAPAVKQAEAKVTEAQRDLDQAQLDLRYCDIVAEINGVVTRRSVNPGDYVVVGQALMAVRSLTDIWVDANFKETQLSALRIGQPVDLDVDMYGRHKHFRGRISGFTNGTGSTLALLPAQNATGNFVKVVQRLPVRIDLLDYDPEKTPLFVGLSVTPYVLIHERPSGPDAGQVLQPYIRTSAAPAVSSSAAPSGR